MRAKKIKHFGRTALLMFLACLATAPSQAQRLTGWQVQVRDYFENYANPAMHTSRSTFSAISVKDSTKTVVVTANGGFKEQYFDKTLVEKIQRDVKALLPDELKDYTVEVVTDDRRISDLVPNAWRAEGEKDPSRRWTQETLASQREAAWVRNVSRPYEASQGLEGAHLALWQSHGRYYDGAKRRWKWQRPNLFCTCEDLLSQTFVVPYLIPMLENAGAVVFTPRERDWQSGEAIVDNDRPQQQGSYTEGTLDATAFRWETAPRPGFAHLKQLYQPTDSPFCDGSARMVRAVPSARHASYAQWVPQIPKRGRYAVYVSYQTVEGSVSDAHYTVRHAGGETQFRVNQRMGGGTWVYLGTFLFDEGQNADGSVMLTNESDEAGGVVTADAVRFGGGMGNILRGMDGNFGGTTSGLPRWAEAARYWTQWAGMPDSVCDYYALASDYKSDILSRPITANELAGGSAFAPHRAGRGVPFELAMAFHTDAGISTADNYVGSLSICTTQANGGLTDAGVDRYTSRDLASMCLAGLSHDLTKYRWHVRKLWNRNYGETRVPLIPSAIVEMLSHQNFADMERAFDPQFRFDLSRSLYKSITRYVADMHGRECVIQPLPVADLDLRLEPQYERVRLTWSPVDDPLEPSARPTAYVVYTRLEQGGWDNGTVVREPAFTMHIDADRIYSFRVCALNAGGQSFPSETLSACQSSKDEGAVLIVNAFTRLSGPATINTASLQGFDLDLDPGVPYGAFAGFCGRQTGFDRARAGSEADDGLGASGSELEGQVVMGNTFDYPLLHGQGVRLTHRHSFTSCSLAAFLKKSGKSLRDYAMIDLIGGVQKDFPAKLWETLGDYSKAGGSLFVSGANLLKDGAVPASLLHTSLHGVVAAKGIDSVRGSGTQFSIFRNLNAESYAVPQPEAIDPADGAFTMLVYSNDLPAATAYAGKDNRVIAFGFPLESITDPAARSQMMGAVVNFLCQ